MKMRISAASTVGFAALIQLLSLPSVIAYRTFDFLKDFPSIPDDRSKETIVHNTLLLNKVLRHNASGNVLRFPVNTTFHFVHGVKASKVNNTVLQIDGTLRFEKASFPNEDPRATLSCIAIEHAHNFTITSQYRGLIDGRGSQYWGVPLIGYVQRGENRPRLLRFNQTVDLLVENIVLQDSPYHTLYLDDVNRAEIRHVSIVARRTKKQSHGWVDLTAFNTDGIDVSGSNVWVHDCDIWVQDDCIAVKDPKNHSTEPHQYHPVSSNMTFERINASGLGFTIGSIQGAHVSNITFRDSYMHRTVKGIYMKFSRPHQTLIDNNISAVVENVTYENITMEAPTQWPIWIGPAQQADSTDFCHPNPCSLCWPMTPGSKCHVVAGSKFRDITLRNIRINNPEMSPGVVLGSDHDSIDNLIFENVLVTQGDPLPISKANFHETFPGTRLPVHDAHVPSYVAKAQHRFAGIMERGRSAIMRAKHALEKTRGTYSSAAVEFVQNGGGAEQWYLSVILQSVLGSIWMWLLLALFMAILSSCVLRHWSRFSRSDGAPNRRWLVHAMYGVLFMVFMFACICSLILPFRKPKWERINRYFSCKGVLNGVARGNTWPVPSCFEYDKQWRASADSFADDSSPAEHSLVDSTIVLMCLSLVMVMVVYCKLSERELSSSTPPLASHESEASQRLLEDEESFEASEEDGLSF